MDGVVIASRDEDLWGPSGVCVVFEDCGAQDDLNLASHLSLCAKAEVKGRSPGTASC